MSSLSCGSSASIAVFVLYHHIVAGYTFIAGGDNGSRRHGIDFASLFCPNVNAGMVTLFQLGIGVFGVDVASRHPCFAKRIFLCFKRCFQVFKALFYTYPVCLGEVYF